MAITRARSNWVWVATDTGWGNVCEFALGNSTRDIGLIYTSVGFPATWGLTCYGGAGTTRVLLEEMAGVSTTGEAIIDISYSEPAQTQWLVSVYWKGTLGTTYSITETGPADRVYFSVNRRISGVTSELRDMYITSDLGTVTSYPWDSTSELDDWTLLLKSPSTNDIAWGSGFLTSAVPNSYIGYRWIQPTVSLLKVCHLQARVGRPLWFYKVDQTQITEQVGATGGASAILTGSSYGLCHAWMTDQGHRALVYEHSGNLSAALWDGDWEPMLVKDARSKPWAIRLEPSNDVWIPCIDASNNLKIDRLVWDGAASTYSVSTTELDTGIDAKDVGGMWIEPNGEVGLAYVNMSDQLAIATGDLSGGSWTL